jgi:plasmid maintenance system antidote protein VapI
MSIDMARRFEVVWGLDMEVLLRMQCACDAYEARSKDGWSDHHRRRALAIA